MVQINKELINKLNQKKYFLNDQKINSIDDLLNNLIDTYNFKNQYKINSGEVSTVRLNKSTIKKLKSLKYYPTESYNSIIFRLLYNDL